MWRYWLYRPWLPWTEKTHYWVLCCKVLLRDWICMHKATQICCFSAWFTFIVLNLADINECAIAPTPCGSNASCINTKGSYICNCASGYKKNGKQCSGKFAFYSRKYLVLFHVLCTRYLNHNALLSFVAWVLFKIEITRDLMKGKMILEYWKTKMTCMNLAVVYSHSDIRCSAAQRFVLNTSKNILRFVYSLSSGTI